jgi:hypothetical protein
MRGLARFVGWVGLLALIGFLGWQVVLVYAPGLTLAAVGQVLWGFVALLGIIAFVVFVIVALFWVYAESW